jgi:hypothetical protein
VHPGQAGAGPHPAGGSVGMACPAAPIVLNRDRQSELTTLRESLEDVFLRLTEDTENNEKAFS